jgi:hypothetical protein
LCWVEIHCDIYTSFYDTSNISYLNMIARKIHPLHHSPLSSSPLHSWNSFNRYYFSIYINEYTVFTP